VRASSAWASSSACEAEAPRKKKFGSCWILGQGIFYEREALVQLTSMYQLVRITCFLYLKYFRLIKNTGYLNKEFNCKEPSTSVRVPWKLGQ
jgi:hypothetical protein